MSKQLSNVLMKFSGEPAHFCPGCNHLHIIHVSKPNMSGGQWDWNGDVEKPTFSPSVHVNGRCHYFLRDGMIQFLDDCTHALAGKTVALPPLPDWVK